MNGRLNLRAIDKLLIQFLVSLIWCAIGFYAKPTIVVYGIELNWLFMTIILVIVLLIASYVYKRRQEDKNNENQNNKHAS
ncbi:hypothetical protein JDS92_19235 [Bacillus cereus group sp. N12]|uniref:hypothetical protein n=1 Tax=Bacillus cereus group sp. N12 TaxID=2794586 RepID=UPI0018F4D1A5|nr:hypothetical protein [Bacillus cereus group sp. N12]MBJ8077481.1 hypothetical protein [Bacillus cereus group sp. N12]